MRDQKALKEKIRMELEELLENEKLEVDQVQINPVKNVIKTFGGRIEGAMLQGYQFQVNFKVKE